MGCGGGCHGFGVDGGDEVPSGVHGLPARCYAEHSCLTAGDDAAVEPDDLAAALVSQAEWTPPTQATSLRRIA